MKNTFGVKRFLTDSKNIARDSYLWNMFGTTLMAFQSVILLMILTRITDLEASGVFTIAYATANLLLTIGKYGLHNFHVSDTAPAFTFGDYRACRWLTVFGMLLIAAGFAVFSTISGQYTMEKMWIVVWMCIFKAIDAIEDVYGSLYQQRGRLDIAGKVMTIRVTVTLLFFALCLVIVKRLLPSLILTTLFSALLMVLLNLPGCAYFQDVVREKASIKRIGMLLWVGCPLALMGFLSYYVTNAPKYSIDRLLNDEIQACYGFIAMPVFVVGLVGNYLFNPVIRSLSERWQNGELGWFCRQLLKQALMVLIITVVCMGGAYLLGIPVLSWLYNTDLSAYRLELVILLACGGFLAFSNQLATALTIIRRQRLLLVGYGICSVIALFGASFIVRRYEILGAALFELLLMIVLCFVQGLILAISVRRMARSLKQQTNSEEELPV